MCNIKNGLTWMILLSAGICVAVAKQPTVTPGPDEPNWWDVLQKQWGLDMDRDLRNPMVDGAVPAALFIKAEADKPVTFVPVVALGTEKTTHGGWYMAGPKAGDLPADVAKAKIETWSYTFKQPAELKDGKFIPPPLASGEATFDPGSRPFGLWVSNENFDDGGVFTQPSLVAKVNARLKAQPYKAMIYPNRDAKKGNLIANSYIIGFEYSTNDDFQDVVTQIDNVRLLPADPVLNGILREDAAVKKLHSEFKFVEGPAWDAKKGVLYFSDIPPAHIVAYENDDVKVANGESGMSNGLMVDKQGLLVRCEHNGRRLSRGPADQKGETIIAEYKGKRLNSPNDLWIDEVGGIYFTDPRYGKRDDLELDKEGVYYVAADGKIERVIDDLIRPNGIALSPTGKLLYVVDNGGDALYRYTVKGPGKIEKGQRIASVSEPDGMAVDKEGRLFIAGHGGVWVLDENGKWVGLIETPEQPANCKFGGKDNSTLFITARTSLYSIDTLTRGWLIHLDGPPSSKK